SYISAFGILNIGGIAHLKNDFIHVGFTLPKAFPEEADYLSYFVPEAKSYALAEEEPEVYIVWVDPDGNMWTSYGGDQTGSSFEITDFRQDNAISETNLVEAVFSCKLYFGSQSKTLTEGEVKGILFSYM